MIALRYMGDGEFRATTRGLAIRCDKQLVIGEALRWEQVSERSGESHRHYFACIDEAWINLPEHLTDEFPSSEHLRKWALIKAGYCDINKFAFRTNADAIKACSFVSKLDSYAVCEVAENIVTVYRAKSQSMKAMGKKEFQESKEKVFHIISNLVGADIVANAEKAA